MEGYMEVERTSMGGISESHWLLANLHNIDSNIDQICKGETTVEKEEMQQIFKEAKKELSSRFCDQKTLSSIVTSLRHIKERAKTYQEANKGKAEVEMSKVIQNGVNDCLHIIERKKSAKTSYLSGDLALENASLKEVTATGAFHEEALSEGEKYLKNAHAQPNKIRNFVRLYCKNELENHAKKEKIADNFLIRKSSTVADVEDKTYFVISQRVSNSLEGKEFTVNHILIYQDPTTGKWARDGKDEAFESLQDLLNQVVPDSKALPIPKPEERKTLYDGYL